MNNLLKYSVVLVVFLGAFQSVEAQFFKKKKKQDCPTYSESLSGSLSYYPQFNVDSLSTANDTITLKEYPKLTSDNVLIDSLLGVQKQYYSNKRSLPGYRIQIWTGQNHIKMQNNIGVFRNEFEEMNLAVHDSYDNAYFRVKVGDFYQNEHLQAYRALVKIRERFPNALLVPADVRL